MSSPRVTRLTAQQYMHVMDNNTNITGIVSGPKTYTRQDHEHILLGPEEMVTIPNGSYCVVSNPAILAEDGQPRKDKFGQTMLRHGDTEIRFTQNNFPLYPGEALTKKVTALPIVAPNQALVLKAMRDFEETVDGQTVKRVAGDEWFFEGPATYMPRKEVEQVETRTATVLKPNQALRLSANRSFVDRFGTPRVTGEEWLVRESQIASTETTKTKKGKRSKGGAYLPSVEETIVKTENAYILTDKKALELCCIKSFTDMFGNKRKAGEQWLVTLSQAETYIADVYEKVIKEVKITTLSNRQYCIVVDPVGKDGKQKFGTREMRTDASFFLHPGNPGERLESGVRDVYVLSEEEALLLCANQAYNDTKENKQHLPGERWMISGPRDFIPPLEVEIVEKRRMIPLDKNEGIYVRDISTGKVVDVVGQSYMLKPNEELWEKNMSDTVDALLAKEAGGGSSRGVRDKTKVVTFPVPHNSCVQIYDYSKKAARVIFGPELVMLGPNEEFTLLSLSGGKPKKPHQIKSLQLALGPDNSTDVITVETMDHARLELQLSYNWFFDVDKTAQSDAAKIFQVPDFIGDMCKQIGSRVRGAVASTTFDHFHRESAKIIRGAVFGVDETGKIGDRYFVEANKLAVTNIDIQSIEPVDQSTRDSLQKSVHMAIEITTKSQEAAARHEQERNDQESRGRLERQRIADERLAEDARKQLLELQAESAAVESTGQAKAEAQARAEAAEIEARGAVKQAELRAQASRIESEAEIEQVEKRRTAEITNTKEVNELEVNKAKELAVIETDKFADVIEAIGPETIKAIATAGPEMQAQLLQGLGLKGFIVTDGNSPINLFNTASGMVSTGGQ